MIIHNTVKAKEEIIQLELNIPTAPIGIGDQQLVMG